MQIRNGFGSNLQYGVGPAGGGSRPNGGPGAAVSADAAEKGEPGGGGLDEGIEEDGEELEQQASSSQPRPKTMYDVVQHHWRQVSENCTRF